MSSNHSPGSNCEEDSCKIFKSMDCLLSNKIKERETAENIEIDYEDINFNIVDFNSNKRIQKFMI